MVSIFYRELQDSEMIYTSGVWNDSLFTYNDGGSLFYPSDTVYDIGSCLVIEAGAAINTIPCEDYISGVLPMCQTTAAGMQSIVRLFLYIL